MRTNEIAAFTGACTSVSDHAVDLSSIPCSVPWALLNEHEAAAVLHLSVKVLRRQRGEGSGPRWRKLNVFSIRYRLSDLQAFIDAQPTGGAGTQARRGPRRPRRTL